MTPKGPLISIVTVVKDDPVAFYKTFESIRSLSWTHIQHIVINGSENEVFKKEIDRVETEVDILISERDEGVYHAMNKALKVCKGSWVHFLNAGDVYLKPNIVEMLLPDMHPQVDLIYSDVLRENINGDRTLWVQSPPKAFGIYSNICHQGVWYNLAKNPKLSYDCNYKISADFHLLMQLMYETKNFTTKYINVALATFKLGGISQQYADLALVEREQTFKKFIKYRLIYWLNLMNLKRQQLKQKRRFPK